MAGEKLFYSINEVSKKTGVEKYVIRFWEGNFPSLIRPERSGLRRRMFREADIAGIMRVKDLLYRQGFTIKGAKKFLNSKGAAKAEAQAHAATQTPPPASPAETPAQKQHILSRWRAAAPNAPEPSPVPPVAERAKPSVPMAQIIREIESIEDILEG